MVKLNTNSLIIAGAAGLGLVVAWETNFLGIRDLFDNFTADLEDLTTPSAPQQQQSQSQQPSEWSYPFNYYPRDTAGTHPQQTHKQQYPFPYPYYPTGYQQTAAPLTLPGAHYQIAGTPNIRQIPGTRTIMAPPTAAMPNPTLWWDKGGIVTPGSRPALPSAINYGPYKFEAPIFSQNRYPIYGTNIDYPFIIPPFCPPDQFMGQDGRCYPTPVYPPI